MKRAATILGCLSILALLSGSAMADSTETTKEAIFDQVFVKEYAAHLESRYGDVAADLWNEETLKDYEAFLYEINGPNAKSYVKENFDIYKPLPVFRFEDTLPPVVDVYDLTPFIEDGDLAAVFHDGFNPDFPEEYLGESTLSEELTPVYSDLRGPSYEGICIVDVNRCIVCGHNDTGNVRIAVGTNDTEGVLKVCASWDSGVKWYRVGWALLKDEYQVPYSCFKYNGGPASEFIQVVQNAISLPNPALIPVCDFEDYSSQFTTKNQVAGNGGYDIIHGSQYADQLYGELTLGWDGDDRLTVQYTTSGPNDHVALGMHGNDRLYGTNDQDWLWGGYGNDTIYGYGGYDWLHGHEHADLAYSLGDDYWEQGVHSEDTIYAGDGGARICGGNNWPGSIYSDRLFGGNLMNNGICGDFCECTDPHADGSMYACNFGGSDYIEGGNQDDSLFGQIDGDEIHGNSGNDLIYGGPGIDTLVGGLGGDQCWGGLPYYDPLLHDIINCETAWDPW